MELIFHLFILIPFVGFLIGLITPARKETLLSAVVYTTVGIHWLVLLGFSGYWLFSGHPVVNIKDISLYQSEDYAFFIDFYFDKISLVYLLTGAFITFLVTIYSRYYLHRETGYKRFFNTMLFFYLGYNITILAGNFETMFVGWEIIGLSSFLLIAFYRDRYLPVKNAIKVFSVYRIGDIGLILAMWASHHLWHQNITFALLNNEELVHEHLDQHSLVGVFISTMILVAAAAKSAQLPFSAWLPRAMEGPTPSSAIFYGSLSVHLGVFLMLRTFPFWEHQTSVRILIGLMGLTTSVFATVIARVQSSIKSQIAYASVTQIGLIFVEISLGWSNIALFHFAGNAFMRTYQLLVSPSVVSYLIREQFYNFVPRRYGIEHALSRRITNSIYQMSVKEWNLDEVMNYILWIPLKNIGRRLDFLTVNRLLALFIPGYLLGVYSLFRQNQVPPGLSEYFPAFFALVSLLMVLKSFSERKSPRMAWLLIIMNHFWMALAVSFNEALTLIESASYLSGVVVAGILGYWALSRLNKLEGSISLNGFFGHSLVHPKMALTFLVACLGVMAFPITPTFIGEDIIFSHVHEDQFVLAFFMACSFVIGGIAIIRIYARVFLGPHSKGDHPVPYHAS